MAVPWTLSMGDSPVVATAIHAGHDLRPEVSRLMAVDERTRHREEDPYTDAWTSITGNTVVVRASRFEMDLNRPRDKAVYLEPWDAWGIKVWRTLPPRGVYDGSLGAYDLFYAQIREYLAELIEQHGRIVVLDLHSYCHRRAGPAQRPDTPSLNPDFNVGTGSLDLAVWGRLVNGFIRDLRRFDIGNTPLDVRENVKFLGGHFPTWINQTFGESACALAVGVKKTFMDEWTGKLDYYAHRRVGQALESTLPGLIECIR